MLTSGKGRYHLRIAETAGDLRAAQSLRWQCFMARNGDPGIPTGGQDRLDRDDLDDLCRHVLIEDRRENRLVCCFRMLHFASGAGINASYSARYYNLSRLAGFKGPMVEMGRFCIHPGSRDPDILRLAWRAMAEYVDSTGVEMLFGCSSFIGTSPEDHAEAFAMLRERHLAPRRWLPRVKAPRVFRFARALRWRKPDPRLAMAAMPPLLRSYLAMGGWVSDHAVVDPALKTMHVFTGVEIRAIPPARRRLMRGAPEEVAG